MDFSKNIQAMRGLAALMIVVGHCLAISNIQLPFWLGGNLIHYFAYAGVDIFFVISGIVVSGVAKKEADHSTNYSSGVTSFHFITKRIFRIYPIYWIVFFTTCLLAPYTGLALNAATSGNAIQSLFLITNNNSIVPQAWTLVFEMFFYVVLSVIIFIGKNRLYHSIAYWMGLTLIACVVCRIFDIDAFIFTDALIFEFGFGCLVSYLIAKEFRPKPQILLLIGMAFFNFGAYQTSIHGLLSALPRMLSFGVGSAFFLYGLLCLEFNAKKRCAKPAVYLGEISYSIYLWHEIAIGLLLYFSSALGDIRTVHPLLFVAFVLCVVIGVSAISYQFIELPFIRFGHRCLGHVDRQIEANWKLAYLKIGAFAVLICAILIFGMRDLLSHHMARKFFAGANLPSQTGQISGAKRVAVPGKDQIGFVTYGPYIPLPIGRYQVAFTYLSLAPQNTVTGRADIADSATGKLLSEFPLFGTDGHEKEIATAFEITNNDGHRIEFRNFWNGVSELQIISVKLSAN